MEFDESILFNHRPVVQQVLDNKILLTDSVHNRFTIKLGHKKEDRHMIH